jgi:hypothetical protein
VGKENIVDINDHKYRYQYDPDSQGTKYLGPVGSSGALSEEDLLRAMAEPPDHTFIWGVDRDGKTRKWSVRAEPLKERIDQLGMGWNEGQPSEDRNRKALYDSILGRAVGCEWESQFVFIDPGEIMDGDNFIDPITLAGKKPGDRLFEMCDILYSTSKRESVAQEPIGFFLPTFEPEEMEVKPIMLCMTRTKRGIPFFILGEHIETSYQAPIQFSHKQIDTFKLWLVVEKVNLQQFFDEISDLYSRDNPARPKSVKMDIHKIRDDLLE